MLIHPHFAQPLASSRKRRKGSGSGCGNQEPQPKNAVAILNELKKNLVYELESQEGPYHAPVFTMSVMVSRNQCMREIELKIF
jgi:dsRNA-specific ribonuclease